MNYTSRAQSLTHSSKPSDYAVLLFRHRSGESSSCWRSTSIRVIGGIEPAGRVVGTGGNVTCKVRVRPVFVTLQLLGSWNHPSVHPLTRGDYPYCAVCTLQACTVIRASEPPPNRNDGAKTAVSSGSSAESRPSPQSPAAKTMQIH